MIRVADVMTIPTELLPIHETLERWAAWANRGVRRIVVKDQRVSVERETISSCASIERNYRIPYRQWQYPDLLAQMEIPPDHIALACERAVQKIPEPYHTFILAFYIDRMPVQLMPRKLHVNWRAVPEYLNKARHMVKNRLQYSAKCV